MNHISLRTPYLFIAQLLVVQLVISGCQSIKHNSQSFPVSDNNPLINFGKTAQGQSTDGTDSQSSIRAIDTRLLDEEQLSLALQNIRSSLVKKNETLQLVLRTETIDTGRCYFTVRYPQVKGLASATIQAQLNSSLRKKSFNSLWGWNDRNSPKCTLRAGEPRTSPKVWRYSSVKVYECIIGLAQETLLSGNCRGFVEPGAHPFFFNQPFTVDLATGKFYDYTDLFKPDTNYSHIVNHQIAIGWMRIYKMSKLSPLASQLKESHSNRDFYIESNCLLSSSDQFSLEGVQTGELCLIALDSGMTEVDVDVPIPIHELKEILNTNGALSVLIK